METIDTPSIRHTDGQYRVAYVGRPSWRAFGKVTCVKIIEFSTTLGELMLLRASESVIARAEGRRSVTKQVEITVPVEYEDVLYRVLAARIKKRGTHFRCTGCLRAVALVALKDVPTAEHEKSLFACHYCDTATTLHYWQGQRISP